jgi:hypothetical protein
MAEATDSVTWLGGLPLEIWADVMSKAVHSEYELDRDTYFNKDIAQLAAVSKRLAPFVLATAYNTAFIKLPALDARQAGLTKFLYRTFHRPADYVRALRISFDLPDPSPAPSSLEFASLLLSLGALTFPKLEGLTLAFASPVGSSALRELVAALPQCPITDVDFTGEGGERASGIEQHVNETLLACPTATCLFLDTLHVGKLPEFTNVFRGMTGLLLANVTFASKYDAKTMVGALPNLQKLGLTCDSTARDVLEDWSPAACFTTLCLAPFTAIQPAIATALFAAVQKLPTLAHVCFFLSEPLISTDIWHRSLLCLPALKTIHCRMSNDISNHAEFVLSLVSLLADPTWQPKLKWVVGESVRFVDTQPACLEVSLLERACRARGVMWGAGVISASWPMF